MCVYTRSALILIAFAGSLCCSVSAFSACPSWDPSCEDENKRAVKPLPRPGPNTTQKRSFKFEALPPRAAKANGVEIKEATSVFVGPHDYPPHEYGAYGIVAFPSAPTAGTRARFIKVCEAYVATLPPAGDTEVPLDQQMVTVWPVSKPGLAKELSGLVELIDRNAGCIKAVDHYHFKTALDAIRQSGSRRSGNGPFLLGWSPASTKGTDDALVLVADLSNLETDEEFLARFQEWRDDIETNPEIFKDQWTVDRLRIVIRDWADRWGNIFLSAGKS